MDILLLIPALSLILTFIYFQVNHKRQCKASNGIEQLPSPKGAWPIFGHALQLNPKMPHHVFTRWAEVLGELFVFKAFGKKHLVINSPKAIYEALVLRGDDFGGRPHMYRADIAYNNGQNVAFQTITPQWKLLRKLSHGSMKQYADGLKRLNNIASLSFDEMLEGFDRKNGSAFDPREAVYVTLTNIVCTLVFGVRIPADDPLLGEVIRMERLYCDGMVSAGDGFLLDLLPALRLTGKNTAYNSLMEAVAVRDRLFAQFMPGLKNRTNTDEKEKSIAEVLVNSQADYGEDILSDGAIVASLTDIILGGTVTTSNSLYAFINIALHEPSVQRRIKAEIDHVLATRKPAGAAAVSSEDKAHMPYTRAVMLELLRYTSIGPLGLPHETVADTHVAGHTVPKGTYVIPNLWAANHDPQFWEDPWIFDPERFLDSDGSVILPDHPKRKLFLPFGAGTRVCLGETFAQNRLFLAIVSMLKKFQILPEDPQNIVSCDPRTYEFGGLLKPQSFKARFVKWDD